MLKHHSAMIFISFHACHYICKWPLQRTSAFLKKKSLLIVANVIYAIIIMLHFLDLSQLSIIKTAVPDSRQETSFDSFFLVFFKCYFFLKSKKVTDLKRVFVIKHEIIQELFPDMFILSDSF